MLNLIRSRISPFLKSLTLNSLNVPQLQTSCNLSSWMNFGKKLGTMNASMLKNTHNQDLLPKPFLSAAPVNISATRSVTKFSLKTGKKRSVRAVLTRFFRLHNGLWIRRIGGCHKHLHKKHKNELFRLRQHVVCTKTQCIMFDKMVTDNWKKKRYYIDDPFEPYHVRNDFDYVKPIRRR